MLKLNFYDIDAVKTFILNILVENEELRQSAECNRSLADAWFRDFKSQKEHTEAVEAKVAAATFTLSTFQKAHKEGVETGWRDVDRIVGAVLDALKGSDKQ